MTMSMDTPPTPRTDTHAHHTLGMWCAWTSLAIPVLATGVWLFARPTWIMPVTIYWMMFACGAVSLVLGCIGISTIGRRLDWQILTPAILGIVLSAVLSYLSLGLGVLSFGGAPR